MRGYAAIGLVRPKHSVNVGGVLRAAHCYGAALVAVQGLAATVNVILYDRLAKYDRAARGVRYKECVA